MSKSLCLLPYQQQSGKKSKDSQIIDLLLDGL